MGTKVLVQFTAAQIYAAIAAPDYLNRTGKFNRGCPLGQVLRGRRDGAERFKPRGRRRLRPGSKVRLRRGALAADDEEGGAAESGEGNRGRLRDGGETGREVVFCDA
jgi:hypothetical protein